MVSMRLILGVRIPSNTNQSKSFCLPCAPDFAPVDPTRVLLF